MGDLVELSTWIAQEMKEEETPEFEAFLLAEGLELLSEFQSIEDPTVRQSILHMVSKIASALRTS